MPSIPDITQQVIFGAGSLSRLGEVAAGLGGHQTFLVTDAGVRKAGIVDAALSSLRSASIECCVFDAVEENPTTHHVEEATALARQLNLHSKNKSAEVVIIGLGGGSAMDCAKGVNFLLSNGGRMEDYRADGGVATKAMLPSIGVPTTAGTGSEAQRFALISAADSHEKMACGDTRARFRSVILDADLLRSVPTLTRCAVGMDALSHAIESFVSTSASAHSRFLSAQALCLLDANFQMSLAMPASSAVRGRMMLGAHWAGAAIERSMLGATHACANPLTARYGIVHGVAIGVLLPHVIRFNAATNKAAYLQLSASLSTTGAAVTAVAERIEILLRESAMPTNLSALGVARDDLPAMAATAALHKTAQFNPRSVTAADLLVLYEAAF